MTNSFRKIDYRLRPAKHTERLMLFEIMKRLRYHHSEAYQYVGFGSVAFIDHKLANRLLGVRKLVSIEGAQDENVKERFRRNAPFSTIDMVFGMSTQAIPKIDWADPSFVWLDYDDNLHRHMALDAAAIGRKAVEGSVIIVSFSTVFADAGAERADEYDRILKAFPEFAELAPTSSSFEKDGLALFAKSVMTSLLEKALSDADAGKKQEDQRVLHQICYFRYRDNGPMCTFAWLIGRRGNMETFARCHLEALPFYKNADQAFIIKVPLVTPYEVRKLEKRLPDVMVATDIDWIPEGERRSFSTLHRYLPHYGVLEPI